MLAEAPLWLQDWARNRNDVPSPSSRPKQYTDLLRLGPLPDYLRDLPRCDGVEEVLKSFETTWSEELERHIRSALECIPANEYNVWIKVGMALKSLGWDRGDGTSIGFELWDEWSATCLDKYSLAVLEAKWLTFNVSYAGQHVTVGTIFHLARQRGWTVGNQSNDQQNEAPISATPSLRSIRRKSSARMALRSPLYTKVCFGDDCRWWRRQVSFEVNPGRLNGYGS
jgi:Primase C terminal 2 (PriCT-2)